VLADKVTALSCAQGDHVGTASRASVYGGQHVHLSMLDASSRSVWVDGAGNDITLLDGDGSQPASFSAECACSGSPTAGPSPPRPQPDFFGMCRAFGVDGWTIRASPRHRCANRTSTSRRLTERCHEGRDDDD
jgi:hypothetical protein